MRAMRFPIAGALICLAAVACSPQPRYTTETYDARLTELHGRHIDLVKRGWGPATLDDTLSDGSRLVQFERIMPTYFAPVKCTTTFEVDAQGIIRGHRFSGRGCRLRPEDDLGLNLE